MLANPDAARRGLRLPARHRRCETAQSEAATASQRRRYSRPSARPLGSLQILGLHAIAVKNVLFPRFRLKRAIGARHNGRPLLDQNDGFCWIRGRAVEARDAARNIWPQEIVLVVLQVFRELAITFFNVALG